MTTPFSFLKTRAVDRELMDDPDSDPALLERTLRQFTVVNRLIARSDGLLNRTVLATMRRAPDRTYRLIELGSGACDTAERLLTRARRMNLHLKIEAIDHDPRVVQYARKTRGGMPGLEIRRGDIMTMALDPAPDFIFGNHILHHLDNDECIRLLKRLNACDETRIVLSDIERSIPAYAGYAAAAALLVRRSFALRDGLTSIRRGFRAGELRDFIARATPSAEGWRVVRMFPYRLVVMRGFG